MAKTRRAGKQGKMTVEWLTGDREPGSGNPELLHFRKKCTLYMLYIEIIPLKNNGNDVETGWNSNFINPDKSFCGKNNIALFSKVHDLPGYGMYAEHPGFDFNNN